MEKELVEGSNCSALEVSFIVLYSFTFYLLKMGKCCCVRLKRKVKVKLGYIAVRSKA